MRAARHIHSQSKSEPSGSLLGIRPSCSLSSNADKTRTAGPPPTTRDRKIPCREDKRRIKTIGETSAERRVHSTGEGRLCKNMRWWGIGDHHMRRKCDCPTTPLSSLLLGSPCPCLSLNSRRAPHTNCPRAKQRLQCLRGHLTSKRPTCMKKGACFHRVHLPVN